MIHIISVYILHVCTQLHKCTHTYIRMSVHVCLLIGRDPISSIRFKRKFRDTRTEKMGQIYVTWILKYMETLRISLWSH